MAHFVIDGSVRRQISELARLHVSRAVDHPAWAAFRPVVWVGAEERKLVWRASRLLRSGIMTQLNAQKALIFRITHIANVPWILRNGLHCKNSAVQDPDFVRIGNLELIAKRAARTVPIPPAGSLSDYIPFYFTPFSMMMYNIKTGYGGIHHFPNSEIVIMASSLRGLAEKGVTAVFSDRHAYLHAVQFFHSLDDLDKIDWTLLQRKDFKRDVDDPEKTDRYQAEALVHRHLPVEHLAGIVCHNENGKRTLEAQREEAGVALTVVARPSWYF